MKITKIFLVLVALSLTLFAEELVINSEPVVRYCTYHSPAVFNISGHNTTEPYTVILKDLHEDGPAMEFLVDLYVNGVNTGTSYAPAGDYTVTYTASPSTLGEQLTIAILDDARFDTTLAPAKFSIQVLQNVAATTPELKVYTKDHHLGNPMIYVLATKIENVGVELISNFKLRYYFTTESTSNSIVLFDYYTPNSSIALLRVPGTNDYALELDYNGFSLAPGACSEVELENQVQMYYTGYGMINKYNDYSNPIPQELNYIPSSVLYEINNKVAVYSEDGTLIYGSEQPGYTASQYVVQ